MIFQEYFKLSNHLKVVKWMNDGHFIVDLPQYDVGLYIKIFISNPCSLIHIYP